MVEVAAAGSGAFESNLWTYMLWLEGRRFIIVVLYCTYYLGTIVHSTIEPEYFGAFVYPAYSGVTSLM